MQQFITTLRDELRGAARFKWPAMAAAWVLCVLGWGAIAFLPSKYEASTRIFVDTKTALSPVIQGLAIQEDVEAYLSLAKESLVGEAQLEQLIDKTSFRERADTPEHRARLVEKLRNEIGISAEPAGERGAARGLIYTLSFRDVERDRGLTIVRILLDRFQQTTLGGKREGSEAAEDFLAAQIQENEKRLREAEQRLADFKRRNVGMMPGLEGDYFTRLQNEMELSRKARATLSVALSRRDALMGQRRGEVPFAVAATSTSGTPPGASGADTSTMIADAERKLAGLLVKYTDKHPDVQSARQEIDDLKRRRARELEALRSGDPEAMLATGAGANPVYQNIQLSLNQADVQIAELRGEIRQREQKVAELRRLVTSVPEVEAELARLNRDYEVTRAQYASLVDRLKQARLGQDAEQASAVRFEIIDPPRVGSRPVSPNRPILVGAVFALSIVAAFGGALLFSRLRPVFNHGREIFATLGLPVLGEVHLTTLDEFKRSARRSLLTFSATAALLLVTFGTVFWLNITRIG